MRPKTAASGRTASGRAGYRPLVMVPNPLLERVPLGDRSWRRGPGRGRIGPARQRFEKGMMDNRKAVLFMICDPDFRL